MRTMTADAVRSILLDLHNLDSFVREFGKGWPASTEIALQHLKGIESRLLLVALSDIAVEPIAPDALPVRVMVEAA